jgi:hypothetical protein
MLELCRRSNDVTFAYWSICGERTNSGADTHPRRGLAQSWRGGPRSAALARLLKQPCTVVQIDERSARTIGEFVASLQLDEPMKPDIVDAHVALLERETRSLVWTSDPTDMARYKVDPSLVRRV